MGDLNRFVSYSDSDSLLIMGPDQISKLKQNRLLGKDGDSATKDGFFPSRPTTPMS